MDFVSPLELRASFGAEDEEGGPGSACGGGSGQFDVGQRTRRGWPGNVTLLRQVLVFDLRRDNMNLFHPFFEFTVARTTDVQCFGLVVGLVTYNLQHKGFVVDVGVGALSVGGKEQSALFFFARCITVREVRGMKLKISFLPKKQ